MIITAVIKSNDDHYHQHRHHHHNHRDDHDYDDHDEEKCKESIGTRPRCQREAKSSHCYLQCSQSPSMIVMMVLMMMMVMMMTMKIIEMTTRRQMGDTQG